MKTPTVEDLSLVVRALHRDVTVLDERLRKLEAIIDAMHSDEPVTQSALDLSMLDAN